MLRLYTNYDKFDEQKVLRFNDAFFDEKVRDGPFDKTATDYMAYYDEAFIIDYDTDPIKVKTKFGRSTDITNLSTGLKTLLNILYMKQHSNGYEAVEVTECGSNILMDIFREARDAKIPLVLKHLSFPQFKDFAVRVDDKKLVTNKSELSVYRYSQIREDEDDEE